MQLSSVFSAKFNVINETALNAHLMLRHLIAVCWDCRYDKTLHGFFSVGYKELNYGWRLRLTKRCGTH